MSILTEKELTVIDRIGDNSGKVTQRQIAQHAGFSLGLTNIILKRLVKRGYIKVRQLTPKKMHYILTPNGISEKTKKSYHYIFKTIKEIRNINNRIQSLFQQEYQAGKRKIGIIGDNDLTEIIKLFNRDIGNMEIVWLGGNSLNENTQGVDIIIDCGDGNQPVKNLPGPKTINLMEYIAKSG